MNSHSPFFSVIVPTYNRAHLIEPTISSLLAQSFDSFEIIVVDDGGTDNTEEVISKLNTEKVRYYKKKNGERGAARNFGWQHANGRYVSFLDSDDLVYPNHLENAHHQLQRLDFPNCFAQGYERRNTATGKVYRHISKSGDTINRIIIKGNFLSCFGVFVKKEIIEVERFEEERSFAGTEDWLLWLKLSALYPFYYDNKVTGALVEHNERSVLSFPEDKLMFRTSFLKKALENNKPFVDAFGNKAITAVHAHMLSYTSLHLTLSGKHQRALHYFRQAVAVNPQELFTKRSFAILKKIFLRF